jgi:hypothetical protein
MRSVVAILLVAALFGCASSTSRERGGVRVTRDAALVERCKHIGAVQTVPPYAMPGEDLEQLRIRTVAIGADTVLLNTARRDSVSGVAYRCRAS